MVKHVEPIYLYKKICKSIVYLLLCGLACLGFCLYTETGSQASLQLINDFTPYHIQYGSFSGTLGNHMHFTELEFGDKTQQIKSKKLSLSWQWLDLLNQTLHIQDIKAEGLQIHTQAIAQTTTTTEPPKDIKLLQQDINQALPIKLKIDQAQILDGKWYYGPQEESLKTLTLRQFDSSKIINTQSIHYDGSYGYIHAEHQKKLDIHWDLSLPEKIAQTYALQSVKTHGDISLLIDDVHDAQDKINIDFSAKQFKHNQYHIQDMLIQIQGSIKQHTITGKGKVANKTSAIKISGQWHENKWHAEIDSMLFDDPRFQSLPTSTGVIDIHYQNQWIVNSDLKIFGQKLKGSLNMSAKAPFTIQGNLDGHIQQLNRFKSLFPILSRTDGEATTQIHIQGTLAKPLWTGKAQIKKLNFPIPQYGSAATLQDIQFIKDAQKINIIGQGFMQGGQFKLTGEAYLPPNTPSLKLNLSGKHLTVSQTPEYYIIADPNLTLSINNQKAELTGQIYIPEADIVKLKKNHKASRSNDVVIVSNNKPKVSTQTAIQNKVETNIDILLGDKISYKGYGLTSQINGKLNLQQKPGKIPTLKGSLNLIDGKFKFQSKVFDLTYGKLLFSGGPMNKPLIDVEARQKIITPLTQQKTTLPAQQIEVGVKLTGEISSPKFSFFSTPNMSEADIMSYLVLGRPQQEATDAQAEILFQAISQLSGMFGSKDKQLSFDLAERLKLDHFGFSKGQQSDSLEDTVLTLGKQLSDRLYLNYSLGLMDTSNSLGLKYFMGKNVSLEAQTGTNGSSADIVISVDGK